MNNSQQSNVNMHFTSIKVFKDENSIVQKIKFTKKHLQET